MQVRRVGTENQANSPDRGTIAVLGQRYVGLPLTVRAAEVGWRVVGFDVDADRIKRRAAGESFVEYVPSSQGVRRVELTAEEVAKAQAVVVLTDHDVFEMDMRSNNAQYVLDTRHSLPAADVVEYL